MLKRLQIDNLAIIDCVNLEFSDGLNIITGETGSGKSIIVNAIDLLMGAKFSKDNFRGDNEARISGDFTINDEELNIKKVFNKSGKHKIFIGGSLATNSELKKIADKYIDMHGQHSQHSILNKDNHIDFLDDFGNYQLLLQNFEATFVDYEKNKTKLLELESNSEEIARKQELYQYQLEEINMIDLYKGVDNDLSLEYNKISNVDRIHKSIETLGYLISNTETGLETCIRKVIRELEGLSDIDQSFAEALRLFSDISINAKEAYYDLEVKKNDYFFDKDLFDKISSNLEHVEMIKRKYGGTIESAISYKDKITNYLNDFKDVDGKIAEVKKIVLNQERRLHDSAKEISKERALSIPVFEKQINQVLHKLNMKDAHLTVEIQMFDRIYSKGIDDCEFYIKTNKGYKIKPVTSIASGGEISRIMLAIKVIMQNRINKNTLIFDEIDMGVSGKTAENLGRNILDLSKNTQVICISHLPQIASKGDCHYRVFKHLKNNKTLSSVTRLDYDDRIGEIAKMLSGKEITDSSRSQAKYLLDA